MKFLLCASVILAVAAPSVAVACHVPWVGSVGVTVYEGESVQAGVWFFDLCEGSQDFHVYIQPFDRRGFEIVFPAEITILSPEGQRCLLLNDCYGDAWTGEFEVRAHDGATLIAGVLVSPHYIMGYHMAGTLDGAPILLRGGPLSMWL